MRSKKMIVPTLACALAISSTLGCAAVHIDEVSPGAPQGQLKISLIKGKHNSGLTLENVFIRMENQTTHKMTSVIEIVIGRKYMLTIAPGDYSLKVVKPSPDVDVKGPDTIRIIEGGVTEIRLEGMCVMIPFPSPRLGPCSLLVDIK